MTFSRRKRFLMLLAAISVAGLVVRLKLCADLGHLAPLVSPADGTDMASYLSIARSILKGSFPDHFYYQPFYYTVFLPGVLLLSSGKTAGVGLVQALVATGCIWLTGLTAARFFGRKAGLFAAGLLAFSRFHIFYTPFLLLAVLHSFWMILLLYLSTTAWHRNRPRDWVGVSLSLSAAVLTRGNAILFLPCVITLLWCRNRSRKCCSLIVATTLVMLVFLPQMPFSLRNFEHFGRWTGPSSAQDVVLALGNTPEAPPGGLTYPLSFQIWMAEADKPANQRTPVSHQILNWMRREPLALPELKFRTFLMFWDRHEIPNNVDIRAFEPHSVLLRTPYLLSFGVIAPLALAGMFNARYRRKPLHIYAAATVAIYCLSTVLFYMLARFRLPILPLLCVFGGHAAESAWRASKRFLFARRTSEASKAVQLLVRICLGIAVVWVALPVYQWRVGPYILRITRPNGALVQGNDAVNILDHGASVPFGWAGHQLTSRPLTVAKTINLPVDVQSQFDRTQSRFEFAFFSAGGGYVEFWSPQQGDRRTIVTQGFSPKGGPQWISVPVPVERRGKTLKAIFTIRLVNGNVSLAVDPSRFYQRTQLASDENNLQPVPFEAVSRVILPAEEN